MFAVAKKRSTARVITSSVKRIQKARAMYSSWLIPLRARNKVGIDHATNSANSELDFVEWIQRLPFSRLRDFSRVYRLNRWRICWSRTIRWLEFPAKARDRRRR